MPPPAPLLALRRLALAVGVAVALLLGWMLLDAWLRIELPFARQLQHVAFRCLVGPLEWLTVDDGMRLNVAIGGSVGAGVLAGVLARFGPSGPWRAWLSLAALLAAAAQVLVVVLGLLMERSLAPALLAAVGVAAWRGLPTAVPGGRRLAVLLGGALGAFALAYVYAVFMTWGEGYSLLQAAGALAREGRSLLLPWAGAVLVAGALAAAVLARLDPGAPARLLPAAGVGLAVFAALQALLAPGGPIWTVAPLLVLVLPVAGLLWSSSAGLPGPLLAPRLLPRRLLVPAGVGLVLLSHAYAARILACPAEPPPFLTKLSTPTEIFRVVQAPGRDFLLLSFREDRRLARLDLPAQPGDPFSWATAGPAAAPGPESRAAEGHLWGTVEELVAAPGQDAFYSSYVPHDPFAWADPQAPPSQWVNNVILRLDGQGRGIDDAVGPPGLCWINTLHWGEAEQGLFVGCEDVPGLHRWDAASKAVVASQESARLGDVQDISFSADGDRLRTISLWFRPTLTELRRGDLSIVRQVPLGGSHYHLVEGDGVLAATAWYGGRMRLVDADSLARTAVVPAGLGSRAVAWSSTLDALLLHSAYDGLLRVCDEDSGAVLGRWPVGGHVKDIAVDDEAGLAWFWSQCGLWQLDLKALAASVEGAG